MKNLSLNLAITRHLGEKNKRDMSANNQQFCNFNAAATFIWNNNNNNIFFINYKSDVIL